MKNCLTACAPTRHLLILTMCLVGCASVVERKVTADKVGFVSKLDENFNISSRLGNLPTELNPDEDVSRFAIQATGLPTEFLIILHPRFVSGSIKMPLLQSSSNIETAIEYEEYLDLILRAHRALLKGELEEAQKTIQYTENQYDVTYGSLVLGANIAAIKGDKDKAKRYFKLAGQLLGEGAHIEPFIVNEKKKK